MMTLELYENITNNLEAQLDEADLQAQSTNERLSHKDVFSNVRSRIKAGR